MNVFSTWALIEFATALHPEHYVESALPDKFLAHIGVARKTARGLIRYIDCHYCVEYKDEDEADIASDDGAAIETRSIVDFAQDFLIDLGITLLTAVKNMETGGYLSSLHPSREYWRWTEALRKKGLDMDLKETADGMEMVIPDGLFPATTETLKVTLNRHFQFPIFDAPMEPSWQAASESRTSDWIGWPSSARTRMRVTQRKPEISHEDALKYGTWTKI